MKFAGHFVFQVLIAITTLIQNRFNAVNLLDEWIFEKRIHAHYYYSKFPLSSWKVMVAYSTLLQRLKCNLLICNEIKTLKSLLKIKYPRHVLPIIANQSECLYISRNVIFLVFPVYSAKILKKSHKTIICSCRYIRCCLKRCRLSL